MVHVDMTTPAESNYKLPPAGTYLCEIRNVQVGTSSKGDAKLSFELWDTGGSGRLATDNIILSGAAWARGKAKLIALGYAADYKGDVDLAGKIAYVELVQDSYVKDGVTKQTLKPNDNAGAHGYWHIKSPPADLAERQAALAKETGDTPF